MKTQMLDTPRTRRHNLSGKTVLILGVYSGRVYFSYDNGQSKVNFETDEDSFKSHSQNVDYSNIGPLDPVYLRALKTVIKKF